MLALDFINERKYIFKSIACAFGDLETLQIRVTSQILSSSNQH
jgi:hypothetical protein